MFAVYGVVLAVRGLRHGGTVPGGSDVSTAPFVVIMVAGALFIGRGGRVFFYFAPVFLGLFSYILAGQFVEKFKLSTYYTPHLKLEQWLPGPLPTLWLQQHLYHGKTGPVETFAVAMYLSHFCVTFAIAFAFVLLGYRSAFVTLMYAILTVLILAEITFVLLPTAPPWLAAEKGHLPPVHHILKDSLYDLHLTKLGNLIGDADKYDVTAAVPSLHIAFPFLCLLVVRRYGLPSWVSGLLVLNILGVAFAIVYTGDHYVIDAIAGVAYSLVAWVFVRRLAGAPVAERIWQPTADTLPLSAD